MIATSTHIHGSTVNQFRFRHRFRPHPAGECGWASPSPADYQGTSWESPPRKLKRIRRQRLRLSAKFFFFFFFFFLLLLFYPAAVKISGLKIPVCSASWSGSPPECNQLLLITHSIPRKNFIKVHRQHFRVSRWTDGQIKTYEGKNIIISWCNNVQFAYSDNLLTVTTLAVYPRSDFTGWCTIAGCRGLVFLVELHIAANFGRDSNECLW